MKELGAELPFEPHADFTAITGSQDGLHISKVIHQAVVEVNEEGTVAAAATGVIMTRMCAMMIEEEEPVEFKVNRPFIFIIHENVHNTVLFIGKVVNPSN